MRRTVRVFFIISLLICLSVFSSSKLDLCLYAKTDSRNVFADESSFDEIICPSGDMANLRNPNLIINSDDTIFVSWESSIYSDNSGSSDQIYMQKIAPNGTFTGSKHLIVNRSDITEETTAIGCSEPIIDSEDNIHLFWYVMDYNSPQRGFVYYKKLSSSLDTLIDNRILVNITQSGVASSIFGNRIPSVLIDNDNFLHILCCEVRYIYLDIEGNIINSYSFDSNILGREAMLEIDNLGNIFIASCKDHDYIFLQHLKSNSSGTYLLNVTSVFYDDDVVLAEPFLTIIDGNLYISWFAANQRTCKKIDYSGVILEENMMGFNNPGYNFLSRNKSNVINLELDGTHWKQENVTFRYSFYTVEGTIIVEPKDILKISYNPMYYYGPDVMYLGCIEDSTGYFWLTWLVNDGTNGFQVLLWKIDYLGIYQIPVICCAPSYFEYEFSACLPPVFSEYNNNVIVFSLVLVIISVSILRFISKINIQKRKK